MPDAKSRSVPLDIFVVEDEFFIALLLEEVLEDLGCRVSYMAGHLPEGMEIARQHDFDFALLDINLGGGDFSFPIAEELESRGLPFAFISSYGRRGLQGRFLAAL